MYQNVFGAFIEIPELSQVGAVVYRYDTLNDHYYPDNVSEVSPDTHRENMRSLERLIHPYNPPPANPIMGNPFLDVHYLAQYTAILLITWQRPWAAMPEVYGTSWQNIKEVLRDAGYGDLVSEVSWEKKNAKELYVRARTR